MKILKTNISSRGRGRLVIRRRKSMEYEFVITSCVRGYHIYKETWTPSIGEEFDCVREHDNTSDRYAVAVTLHDRTIVGHLAKKISKVCSLFLRRGGFINCTITGNRRNSADLIQGGLELPCTLHFRAA